MPNNDTVAYIQVKVATMEFTSNVKSVEVEDNARLIDKVTLVLEDPNACIAHIPQEDQTIQVDMGWMNEHQVMFEGKVTSVNVQTGTETEQVTVVAYDCAYLMMQSGPKTRDHHGTLKSILTTIVGEYSIQIGKIEPNPDPEFRDEEGQRLRQQNKKDWEFIQDLAYEYGAVAFVEYNDNKSKFYFLTLQSLKDGDAMGSLTYCRGYSELIEFSYQRIAGGAAVTRTATTADPGTGAPTQPVTPPPATPEPPARADPDTSTRLAATSPTAAAQYDQAMTTAAAAGNQPASQRPRAPVPGSPSDPRLPERVSRPDPTRILGYIGNGTAIGTVKLRAKGKVKILGLAPWAEGEWYVQKVTHRYTRTSEKDSARNTYRSQFVVTR